MFRLLGNVSGVGASVAVSTDLDGTKPTGRDRRRVVRAPQTPLRVYVCVCVCVHTRVHVACVRAWMCACAHMHVCVGLCLFVCVGRLCVSYRTGMSVHCVRLQDDARSIAAGRTVVGSFIGDGRPPKAGSPVERTQSIFQQGVSG